MLVWKSYPKIFVSYRRSDAGGYAGQLVARLKDYYGRTVIFQDVERISAGQNFTEALKTALQNCDVVLAVIGPDWINASNPEGQRRLDDPEDWVVLEIATALKLNRRAIPVLVGDAELPTKQSLPPVLKDLVDLQARIVRPERFEDDVRFLIESIGGHTKKVMGIPLLRLVIIAILSLTAIVGYHLSTRIRPMTGDFNIAVAQFDTLKRSGHENLTNDAAQLSKTVYERISGELQTLNEQGFNFEVIPPSKIGSFRGKTQIDRAVDADNIAERLHADVVVFGILTESEFKPEFFLKLRGDNFRGAEELTGQHELGSTLFRSSVGAGNLTKNMWLRKEITARTNALAQFVIGLSWYATKDYERARAAFQRALTTPAWRDEDGKEVLHLFLGNTAAKLGDLKTAEAEFDRALEINPDYARGLLGAAEVLYLQSSNGCKIQAADGKGLYLAAEHYRAARSAKLKPALSNVDAKATFGIGRVKTCLSLALIEDCWRDAALQFEQVVQLYENGNSAIKDLAVEAYAGLGLTSLPPKDASEPIPAICNAKSYYESARQLSDDQNRIKVFNDMLQFLSRRLKEEESSCP